MLPKTHRLARQDFLLAKLNGKSYSFPHFSVIVYSRSSTLPLSSSRFAIVTSSKLHKHAVVRNRLRRRLYDLARDLPGTNDIIIFPKKSIFAASNSELFQALLKISPLASPS